MEVLDTRKEETEGRLEIEVCSGKIRRNVADSVTIGIFFVSDYSIDNYKLIFSLVFLMVKTIRTEYRGDHWGGNGYKEHMDVEVKCKSVDNWVYQLAKAYHLAKT